MKITTFLCCGYLILMGVLISVSALAGFNLLLFLTAGNKIVYRIALSFTGICALWLLFWLVAFRPAKYIS